MKKKHIFVYDSVLSPAGQRGVNRYFLNFLESLAKTYAEHVLVYSQREFDFGHFHQIRPYSSRRYLQTPSKLRKAVEIFDSYFIEVLANQKAQLFYSPYFGSVKTKAPQVYTLPDMIYEKFPQYFDPGDVKHQDFIAEKRACLERAALILPISKSAASDLQEVYPHLPSERIKVVYLGVDDLFFQPHPSSSSDKPYFLFVGNRDRYKNFLRFIEAFGKSGLKKKFRLRIIFPYRTDYARDEKEIILRYGLEACIDTEYAISDEELKERYSESFAFVYPSEYEGFGLPVIEALASGTLVLTSRASSLPEVGGPAPLYFEPTSTEDILGTLKFASEMTDSARQERIQLGKNWAAQFTWENSQRSFIKAIDGLRKEL